MPWEKQFDRTHALQRALRVFWKTGYEKSSLSVLLKGMGVQKGSFYATFGSKHKVLVEALELYIKQRFESFLAVSAGRPPLAALRRHLDEVVRESTGSDRFMGCFLVNCATELAPRDREIREIVATTLRAHAQFYQSLLDQAQGTGRAAEGRSTRRRRRRRCWGSSSACASAREEALQRRHCRPCGTRPTHSSPSAKFFALYLYRSVNTTNVKEMNVWRSRTRWHW